MQTPSGTGQSSQTSPAIYILLMAVLLADGIQRLVFRSDIPVGILQISVPIGWLVWFLLGKRHMAVRELRVAWAAIAAGAGVAEIAHGRPIWAIAVLGLAGLSLCLAFFDSGAVRPPGRGVVPGKAD